MLSIANQNGFVIPYNESIRLQTGYRLNFTHFPRKVNVFLLHESWKLILTQPRTHDIRWLVQVMDNFLYAANCNLEKIPSKPPKYISWDFSKLWGFRSKSPILLQWINLGSGITWRPVLWPHVVEKVSSSQRLRLLSWRNGQLQILTNLIKSLPFTTYEIWAVPTAVWYQVPCKTRSKYETIKTGFLMYMFISQIY